MSVIVTEREGAVALFIDGNLQFDSQDEAIYHESLVLPALSILAERGSPTSRVLICGGGDGLALRECLRLPGVESVDLVDLSEEVVELARTRFADLNARSMGDPRVRVHIGNAWDWVGAAPYDLVVCDFTVPTTDEEAALLGQEWFERVGGMLSDTGIAVFNAVSPEKSKAAFWCVVNSVKAAKLHALPYRACVPSFRAMGYGTWGFVLASRAPLLLSDLRVQNCPVECRQTDVTRIWRGARFSRAERMNAKSIPVNCAADPCLMRLLLDPRPQRSETDEEVFDLESLIEAIPLSHPSHTREMIRSLTEQVAGAVRTVDLKRLVEEIWKRAERLSVRLRLEIQRLREFLKTHFTLDLGWHSWSAKLFATLIIVLTIANTISPDNAFAKGSFGLGHASFSRGSFGRAGGFSHLGEAEHGVVTGPGFRSSSISGGGPVDIYGYRYAPRVYRYYDYGPGYGYWGGNYGGYYGQGYSNQQQGGAQQEPQDHKPLFVADDDVMVLDNGDVIITVSDDSFLLARNGTLSLVSQKNGPLMPMYPDGDLFGNLASSLKGQQATARLAEESRNDWLSWTGWTASMFDSVRQDKIEAKNLGDLQQKLGKAIQGLGEGKPKFEALPAGATELFVGCYTYTDNAANVIVFINPEAQKIVMSASTVTDAAGKTHDVPPALATTMRSILNKLAKELSNDLVSYDKDIAQDHSDLAASNNDLTQYNDLYTSNGYDPTYSVDYGTDEIGVQDAIDRTQNDINSINIDITQLQAQKGKATQDLANVQNMLIAMGQAG